MGVNTGVQAGFVVGKPIMVAYDAGSSTINAGDVVVVGATPCVAHVAIPAFTGGATKDALAVGGGVYQCVTDGTGVVGDRVFWDATNKKITATAAGNTGFGVLVAGPTFLLSGASPASDTDLCWVYHEPSGVATNVMSGSRSEATASGTATLTIAQLLGGLINSVPVAGITLTLPTAANVIAGIPGCKVGDSFDVTIENSSAGANAITLAAGGATLRGGTSIAQNKAALLRVLLTNVTPSSEAYTVHSLIGA